MEQIDYSFVRRTRVNFRRFELTEPEAGGSFVIWLARLGPLDEDAAEETAATYISKYVTGGFFHQTTGQWTREPIPYAQIDDQNVRLSARSLKEMGRIVEMQAYAPAGEKRHSIDDLINCAVLTPGIYRQLKAVAAVVQFGDEEDLSRLDQPGKGLASSDAAPIF
jgi:hypothetical protein